MLKVFINRWCCVSVYIHILICKIKEMFVVFLFSKLLTFFLKKGGITYKNDFFNKCDCVFNKIVILLKILLIIYVYNQ